MRHCGLLQFLPSLDNGRRSQYQALIKNMGQAVQRDPFLDGPQIVINDGVHHVAEGLGKYNHSGEDQAGHKRVVEDRIERRDHGEGYGENMERLAA